MGLDESRPFLFSFTMMVIYLLLLSQVPTTLYLHSYTQHDYNIPPYFDGVDISIYSASYNFSIEDGETTQYFAIRYKDWSLGGFDWRFTCDTSYTYIQLGKRNIWGIFLISTDYMEFVSEDGVNRGTQLSDNEMDLDFAGNETWIHYRLQLEDQPEIGCDVYLGFNTSLYNSPSDALNNQNLTLLQTLGIDDLYTSFNFWRILGQLMFLQTPDIHPLLNVVLIAPMWGNILWAALIVFTKLIPGLG